MTGPVPDPMAPLDATPWRTLVLGGARSGKSGYAERLAAEAGGPVRYVATAVVDPDDGDFAARIAVHRARRPAQWSACEAGADLAEIIRTETGLVLVDDIGAWLAGRVDARAGWEAPRGVTGPDTDDLVSAVERAAGRLVLVSPEVGLGVIPATRSGRLFRDELGSLNQRLAAICDEVYFVVAGLATRLK